MKRAVAATGILALFIIAASGASAGIAPAPASAPTAPSFPSSPGEVIRNFFFFTLFGSGFLALGAIVWGAIKYTAAAGNPSAQKDGKEWITEALKGLLLLFGAVILLRTINPDLLDLNILKFAELEGRKLGMNKCGDKICEAGTFCVHIGPTLNETECRKYTPPEEKTCKDVRCPAGETCSVGPTGQPLCRKPEPSRCVPECPAGCGCIEGTKGTSGGWSCQEKYYCGTAAHYRDCGSQAPPKCP